MSRNMVEEFRERQRGVAEFVSDLLVTALRQPDRDGAMRAAYIDGDPRSLYIWEREALRWLDYQKSRDPETTMNAWTAELVKRTRAALADGES